MVAAAVWPLIIYTILAFSVPLAMIVISYFLGERSSNETNQIPYESGIIPASTDRLRYSVRYYLMAMFFVIFDVESIFIFAWSVSFRKLGWSAFIEMVIFITVLLVILVYL